MFNMRIKDCSHHIQPREKLLRFGVASLSDVELLAIFIQTGTPGENALMKACRLLNEYGSLKALLDQPFTVYKQLSGFGKAKFALLQAALELALRYCQTDLIESKTVCFRSSEALREFLTLYFRQLHQEMVACLFLNQQHQLITVETLFQGSINHAPIFPREIVARSIFHAAPAIILAHNHPSGDSTPSQFDIEITRQLRDQLRFLDIHLLDHCIITSRDVYSLAELD